MLSALLDTAGSLSNGTVPLSLSLSPLRKSKSALFGRPGYGKGALPSSSRSGTKDPLRW